MESKWVPDSAVVARFASLVRAGSSIRAAAGVVCLPESVAYRLAGELDLPRKRCRRISSADSQEIARLWLEGVAPMDIARQLSIGSSPVYRIGIELGLWKRNPHGRKAAATTRRCSYLQLRVNALGRKDAALACGIHPRDAADMDKGVIKLSAGRVPFVPAGPDVALYNRLMQVIEYVDGRQAVPVQVIPQERIDRRISSRYLSVEERELIFDLDRQGKGVREIARRLQRSAGTISKELKRNRDEFGVYLPTYAHRKSVLRRFRPKKRKIDANPRLRTVIWEMVKDRYSPEQISGRLRSRYPGDETMYVCPETIYQSLYFQAKGELKKEVAAALRRGHAQRRPRGTRSARKRFVDPMVMISDRPAEVDDRAVPGHWEGDLILGAGNKSAIGTLVERTTRYVILLHLPHGHNATEVNAALTKAIATLPDHLKGSLTWDQGSEMACHKAFSVATNCPVFFCDPGSPWQRGTNENTNGLLRQYFPKGTDLSVHSAADLEFVAMQLNRRPRKTLGFQTPAEKMAALINSTET